jgi:DNA-binding NtrC family response regulator
MLRCSAPFVANVMADQFEARGRCEQPQWGKRWLPKQRQTERSLWQYKCLMSAMPHIVLVVEDEEALRRLVRLILESAGYLVLDASNGREGLDLCKAHSGPIDVLLSDVVMPELGGRDLAERALQIRPELKVILMSGYHDDDLVKEAVRKGAAFLKKPFSSGDLTQTVCATLSLQASA